MSNDLPGAEQIMEWLGPGWVFCSVHWATLNHKHVEPWTGARTLYLRHESGRRVTVRAPEGYEPDWGAWFWNIHFDIERDGDKPCTTSAGVYESHTTFHDPDPSPVVDLGELEVGEWFEFIDAEPYLQGPREVVERKSDTVFSMPSPYPDPLMSSIMAEVRRVPQPSETDLAGGSVDAATRKDAASESSGNDVWTSPQPPAVCSNCGEPFNEYRKQCRWPVHAFDAMMLVAPGPHCTDCVALGVNGTQHPAPPKPDEPGPHDWDCFATSGWEWP